MRSICDACLVHVYTRIHMFSPQVLQKRAGFYSARDKQQWLGGARVEILADIFLR